MDNRPKMGQQRIPPADLCSHHREHQFLGPGCFCPLLQNLSEEPGFIEAAIYIPVFGHCGGEYVAACAKNRCGYTGEYELFFTTDGELTLHYWPVPLDRVHLKANVLAKTFHLRGRCSVP